MVLFRLIILLLLLASGVSFAAFALTGKQKYKRFGLAVLKWTLAAALGFFLILALDRWFS